MNAVTLTRALKKGHWHGRYGTALCPAHSDKTPSLSISDGNNGAPIVKCFAGCPQAAVIDALDRLGLWPDKTRGSYTEPREATSEIPKLDETKGNDDTARTARALAIWGEARPLEGTVALTYLARRGVDIQAMPDMHHALRWHPACPWESGKHGAIVALFTDAISGEPKAIHRIAITPNGEKAGKKMLGPAGRCVIRLWPDDTVTTGLVLAEGVETTLAAATRITHKGTRLQPAWAAGSAGTMARFTVLPGVEVLTLLVDHDESGAGQRAALECSARWTAAGREVVRLVPNTMGTDFADLGGRAA